MSRQALRARSRDDAPPRWAVVVVRCCVVGILLLPVLTLVWAFAYTPTEARDLGPIAFGVVLTLAVGMFSCAVLLTTSYPPVRRDRRR